MWFAKRIKLACFIQSVLFTFLSHSIAFSTNISSSESGEVEALQGPADIGTGIGDECSFTFDLVKGKSVLLSPQYVVDSINQVIRSDLELLSSASNTTLNVVAVPKFQGKLPLLLGPYYYDQTLSKQQLSWLLQDQLLVDKPLAPLLPPPHLVSPDVKLQLSQAAKEAILHNAFSHLQVMENVLLERAHLAQGVRIMLFGAIMSVCIISLLQAFIRQHRLQRRYSQAIQWGQEFDRIQQLQMQKAAYELDKLLCRYLAMTIQRTDPSKILSDLLTLRDLSELAERHDWLMLSKNLEEAQYKKSSINMDEAVFIARRLVGSS